MNLPLYIASRYLFARKSHNIINVISAISAIGMAIGSAAIIIILSVYNGFDSLVTASRSGDMPDLLVEPVHGKSFSMDELALVELGSVDGVDMIWPALSEQVFVIYEGEQGVARAKGVEDGYRGYELSFGTLPRFAVGKSVASDLGIDSRFLAMVQLWFPDRNAPVSLSDPMSSLNFIEARPGAIFQTSNESDSDVILVPIDMMRTLVGADPDEYSSLEIHFLPDADALFVERVIGEILGPDFSVKNRERQDEALFKMMRYEKFAIFLILVFVIIIIAFNIFSSLSLLIIEKKEDIGTLEALGLSSSEIRKVFVLEGWLISLCGMIAGTILGLSFAYLQSQLGFIRMPAGFVVDSYPILVKFSDVALTVLCVTFIGYLMANIPVLGKKFGR